MTGGYFYLEARILPEAFEPDYWNIVFHPSESRLSRIFIGRYQHVSAFTYVPGFGCWVIYDAQWSGTRVGFFSREVASYAFIRHTKNCAIVKFHRRDRHLGILSRWGFYCVPATKQLLGLSCVAAFPDGLYRHLIANGGIRIDERVEPTAAAARPDAGAGAGAGAS